MLGGDVGQMGRLACGRWTKRGDDRSHATLLAVERQLAKRIPAPELPARITNYRELL